jgi:hypothetical protein
MGAYYLGCGPPLGIHTTCHYFHCLPGHGLLAHLPTVGSICSKKCPHEQNRVTTSWSQHLLTINHICPANRTPIQQDDPVINLRHLHELIHSCPTSLTSFNWLHVFSTPLHHKIALGHIPQLLLQTTTPVNNHATMFLHNTQHGHPRSLPAKRFNMQPNPLQIHTMLSPLWVPIT